MGLGTLLLKVVMMNSSLNVWQKFALVQSLWDSGLCSVPLPLFSFFTPNPLSCTPVVQGTAQWSRQSQSWPLVLVSSIPLIILPQRKGDAWVSQVLSFSLKWQVFKTHRDAGKIVKGLRHFTCMWPALVHPKYHTWSSEDHQEWHLEQSGVSAEHCWVWLPNKKKTRQKWKTFQGYDTINRPRRRDDSPWWLRNLAK